MSRDQTDQQDAAELTERMRRVAPNLYASSLVRSYRIIRARGEHPTTVMRRMIEHVGALQERKAIRPVEEGLPSNATALERFAAAVLKLDKALENNDKAARSAAEFDLARTQMRLLDASVNDREQEILQPVPRALRLSGRLEDAEADRRALAALQYLSPDGVQASLYLTQAAMISAESKNDQAGAIGYRLGAAAIERHMKERNIPLSPAAAQPKPEAARIRPRHRGVER